MLACIYGTVSSVLITILPSNIVKSPSSYLVLFLLRPFFAKADDCPIKKFPVEFKSTLIIQEVYQISLQVINIDIYNKTEFVIVSPVDLPRLPQTHRNSRVLVPRVCHRAARSKVIDPPTRVGWRNQHSLSVASSAATAAPFLVSTKISFLDGRMLYRRLLRRPPSPQEGKGVHRTPRARRRRRRRTPPR